MRLPECTIVLVGAGHAHLYVMAQAHRLRAMGARLIVVDPGDFWYSDLATGMLGGMYAPEEDRVDVARLVEHHGGEFVRDRAMGLDREAGAILLQSDKRLAYDFASFNIGSEPDVSNLEVDRGNVWMVKPISNLARLREHFTGRRARGRASAIVIGGGATGCEIAANLAELARRADTVADVLLISRSPRLMRDQWRAISRSIQRALVRRGIRLHMDCAVERVEESTVYCADGSAHRADTIVIATGLRAPALIAQFGLSCSTAGLRVDATLRSVDDRRVFGAGDCIDFDGRNLPKLGVFGVRQAPVLLENLCASLANAALTRYRPQRRWLTILNLGRGEALAMRGRLWWRGRLAMRLKDRLDRRFLARYRTT